MALPTLSQMDSATLIQLYQLEYSRQVASGPFGRDKNLAQCANHTQNLVAILEHIAANGQCETDRLNAKKVLVHTYAQQDIYFVRPILPFPRDESLRDTDKAVAMMLALPEEHQHHIYLGTHYFVQRDYPRAVLYLQKDRGEYPDGLYLMGLALKQMGPEHRQAALVAFVRLIQHAASIKSFDPTDLIEKATKEVIDLLAETQGTDGLHGALMRAILAAPDKVRPIANCPVEHDAILFRR